MQFSVPLIAIALLACAAPAKSVEITFFAGAGCTGSVVYGGNYGDAECVNLGGGSAKSVSYSGVPKFIEFFESGGLHDYCTNGAYQLGEPGSGCATAPPGFNWESVFFY